MPLIMIDTWATTYLLPATYVVFVVATVVQLVYWGVIFAKAAFYKRPKLAEEAMEPISVVICARNEAENLRKYLPLILRQDYHKYEVIVVNDRSEDHSLTILEEYQKQFSYLRIINNSNTKNLYVGKKLALTLGVESATYDWILVTDADCFPRTNQWIQEMAVTAASGKSIGLGYSPYVYRPGLLNAFIRYETLLTAFQYLSHTLWGHPYMGVGRNLLYHKSLFTQVGGFTSHEHIASGDDDLFVRQVATAQNTLVVSTAASVMYSLPKTTYREWMTQKARHMVTGKHYKTKHILSLGLFSMTHFFHVLGGIILLITGFGTIVALVGYILRTLIIFLMYGVMRNKFREKNDWYWIPILDVLFIFYYLRFLPALFSTKTKSWK